MRKLIVLSLMIFMFISCDEINKIINPPSDEYLIDKTVSASTTEQIIESGNDIKIIFPANCLNGNLVLKIKKETSVPAFSISNMKIGNNVYKIKYSGNTVFSTLIKIIINYDKSQIPPGKSAAETINGYIYANGNWKLSDFVLDEENSTIIFSVSNLVSPKTGKNNSVLLDNEGETIFGDGYTTTDNGQKDLNKVEIPSSALSHNFEGYTIMKFNLSGTLACKAITWEDPYILLSGDIVEIVTHIDSEKLPTDFISSLNMHNLVLETGSGNAEQSGNTLKWTKDFSVSKYKYTAVLTSYYIHIEDYEGKIVFTKDFGSLNFSFPFTSSYFSPYQSWDAYIGCNFDINEIKYDHNWKETNNRDYKSGVGLIHLRLYPKF